MFGTLILQLPTEEGYTGGELIVQHHKEEKHFDCHMVSPLGFCYTAFFADCLHELQKVESGTRPCLAFNLIKCDPSLDPLHRDFISSKVPSVEAALEPWLQVVLEGSPGAFGGKLAIPLRHKYTEGNLSFSMLKGEDSYVAAVLKECRDRSREPWLDLHLCLVTKYLYGFPAQRRPHYNRRRYAYGCDSDSDSADGIVGIKHTMKSIEEEKIEFKNWIGEDDRPPSGPFQNLGINLETEVVIGEGVGPFHKPDDEDYEGYMGNYGPKLEYWYHTTMLVLWPRSKSISIACESGVAGALDWLERTTEMSDPKFSERFLQVVCCCEKKLWKVWGGAKGVSSEDLVTPRLIRVCTSANLLDALSQIFEMLAKDFQYKPPRTFYDDDDGTLKTAKVGVRNAEVVKAIATSIQVFGWEAVSSCILALVKGCALNDGQSFAQLAKECYGMEKESAGLLWLLQRLRFLRPVLPKLGHRKSLFSLGANPMQGFQTFQTLRNFSEGPTRNMCTLCRAYLMQDHLGTSTSTSVLLIKMGMVPGQTRGEWVVVHSVRFRKRHFFDIEAKEWQKEQDIMKGLKSTLENLRSGVHQAITAVMAPIIFGQSDSKRPRLDSKVLEESTKTARSGGLELEKLRSDVHEAITAAMGSVFFGQSDSKRPRLPSELPEDSSKRARSGGLELIDLTGDVQESQLKVGLQCACCDGPRLTRNESDRSYFKIEDRYKCGCKRHLLFLAVQFSTLNCSNALHDSRRPPQLF